MEQLNPTPAPPITLPISNIPPQSPQVSSNPPEKSKGILIAIVAIFAVVITAVVCYLVFNPKSPSDSSISDQSPSSEPNLTNSSSFQVIENSQDKLVYLRSPSLDKPTEKEVWLYDVQTGAEDKLDIANVYLAYKHLNSSKLFYIIGDGQGVVHEVDLSQGTDVSHTLIKHPDPTAKTSIIINSIADISDSGRFMMFGASFFTDCPPRSPLPSGFEGGFGPCQPDESVDTPSGNYLYDFESKKATPLIDMFRVSRWDEAGRKLYYVTNSQTKVLDLEAKTVGMIDSTSSFGYFTYPLLKSKQLVKFDGTTEKGVRLFLTDSQSQELGEIEGFSPWAILQPFITSSPDEKNIVYVKTANNPEGMRPNFLRAYNIDSKKNLDITPTNISTTYSIYAAWLDNTTLITTELVSDKANYANSKKNLVKINVDTGELTPLTTHGKVFLFNMQ